MNRISMLRMAASGFLCLATTYGVAASKTKSPFQGAIPNPMGITDEAPDQLEIRFPSAIDKKTLQSPFSVKCSPAVEGFASWSDNDTLWTYTFKKAEGDDYRPVMVGGTQCDVTQTEEIQSNPNLKWAKGTLNYKVTVQGPKVSEVYVAHGFQQMLREKEPLFLISFNGPVNRESFFQGNNNYLSYVSNNAPSEKLALIPVPTEQTEVLFNEFKARRYFDLKFNETNWILATTAQNLIPGASIQLTIKNQESAVNKDVTMPIAYTSEYSVRNHFQAEIQCSNPSANDASCLPGSQIVVNFNGRAKWTDIRDTYIEFTPQNSADGATTIVKAEMNGQTEVDLFDSFINYLSNYFPFLASLSDTVVDSIVFKVNIEPESQARIVLPQNISDIDGRPLANALTQFNIRISSMDEWINTPRSLSIFERKVQNLSLPVGIVNLNQSISIRRSGANNQTWTPITDVPTMIQLIRKYEKLGEYRNTPNYTSPLEELQVPNSITAQTLAGKKNRAEVLQFPFGSPNQVPESGLYALEVSSPTLDAIRSDSKYENYLNPQHVLAQVSDLTIHIKKGKSSHLLWVTRLSDASPVPNADLQIYNCLGQNVESLKTNSQGLVILPNKTWADDCRNENYEYSSYASKDHYFVLALSEGDKVLAHSSWSSPNTYALSSPGMEWFTSHVYENRINYHSIVGVNLVKPGQIVPVQIVATHPIPRGFKSLDDHQLPKVARVVSIDDDSLFYDFELKWNQGTANFIWPVPSGSAAKLGGYRVLIVDNDQRYPFIDTDGDIEVAEFKVPLMSGVITPPKPDHAKPEQLPVTAMVRYANGIGAKNLNTSLSFYFQPTTFQSKTLEDFNFGSGPLQLNEDGQKSSITYLPNSDRPSLLENIKTSNEGSISFDIASERALNGESIAEALKHVEQPQNLIVRLRYQDQMGEFQTLSRSQEIYNSDLYVGTRVIAGEQAKASIQAAMVDIKDSNVTTINDLNLSVQKIETRVIGEQLYGGIIKNSVQKLLKDANWKNNCSIDNKIVSCPLSNLAAGTYVFEAKSKSTAQMAHSLFKVDTNGRVYGSSSYYDFGDSSDNKSLALALDKPLYQSGNSAVVSFSPPFKKCQALVTLERSDVLKSFTADNVCETGKVIIPIDTEMAPNVYVSVYLVSGRVSSGTEKLGDQDLGKPTYRLGFANIKVDWQRFRSQVKVTLNKDNFKPREMVEVKAQVTPDLGQLTEGKVTFVAIEEKMLELRPNETYQLLSSMMQMRYHDVETISSLEQIETTTGAERSLGKDRKGGEEGGDGGSTSQSRKLFDALVAFKPGVPVVNGEASFSFPANDSLTSFKVFAIAMDSNFKFGVGDSRYLSSQDFQTYANIPAVAYTEDNFPLKVTVQNNSKSPSTLRAELTVTSKFGKGLPNETKVLTGGSKIDPQGSGTIDFGNLTLAKGVQGVDYVIRIYDEKGQIVDIVENPNQVIYPSVPLVTQNSILVQMANPQWDKKWTKVENALPSAGELKVTVSNSLVESALTLIQNKAKDSATADVFLESALYKALILGTADHSSDLKTVMNLLQTQVDSNGFIKYYPRSSKGDLYLTGEILKILGSKPWALEIIPPSLVTKFKGAIRSVVSREVDAEYVGTTPMEWTRARALMGQAAFVFPDTQLQDLAKEVYGEIVSTMEQDPKPYGTPLDQWSTADLLLVLGLQSKVFPDRVLKSKTLARLSQKSRLIYAGNSAQLKGAPEFRWFYSDETIHSAELLRIYAGVKGGPDLARSLALGLVNASSKGGWYNLSSLINTAIALEAFGSVYEAEKVAGTSQLQIPEVNINESLTWNAAPLFDFRVDWESTTGTVKLNHSGSGKPWIGVQARSAVPLKEAYGQGVTIDKSIRNLTRDNGFQVGDVIEVELKINSATSTQHLVLHDPIPAGSNIIGDAYGYYDSGEKKYSGYWFYFQRLNNGLSSVKYQFQLNNPGTFSMPPTHIEGIYLPSIFADTPNSVIDVK